MSHSEFTNSFFQEPWWLDAVAPGAWDAVDVDQGGRTVARLPFVIKRKFGLRVLTQPQLTQTLGPWMSNNGLNNTKRLSREKDLYSKLINALPKHDMFVQNFHPSITNWLPFYWHGFEQTTRYTYELDLANSTDELLSSCSKSTRASIRQSAANVHVEVSDDLEAFLDVNEKTFQRQGMTLPYERDYVHRIDQALGPRGKRLILLARSADSGLVEAGAYIAGDARRMYLMMSGSDPDRRTAGSGELLSWTAISEAKKMGASVFDFEGSMIEPVESFYRGFGPVQTPYMTVSKTPPLVQIARQVARFRR